MTRNHLTVAMLAAALTLPATAAAHVTLQPNEAPSGGFTRLDVRVPNERDNAGTTKVDVQFPDGFAFVSYERVPVWTTKVTTEKLAEPIKSDEGEEIDEQVTRVTWTAADKDAAIAPGRFQDFGLSLAMPEGKAGSKLTFKAVQTYDNGEVVRWIGPPDAEEPAPQVTLVAAATSTAGATPTAAATAAPAAASEDDDDGSNGLAIAALIVGGLGLLAGGAGVAMARRAARSGGATPPRSA